MRRALVLLAALIPVTLCLGRYGPGKRGNRCAEERQFCIVGAGPAGVQLGHFLHDAGRDYVTFERGSGVGSFFKEFPVHRTLNSINRRNTRARPNHTASNEFDLRHDHNSLLGDHVPPFRTKVEEYWAPADKLVEYLEAT